MYSKQQQGKGLAGFILGLLLATAAILGILYMLNNNKERDFKPRLQENQPTKEELTPPPQHISPPQVSPASEPASAAKTSENNTSFDEPNNDVVEPNVIEDNNRSNIIVKPQEQSHSRISEQRAHSIERKSEKVIEKKIAEKRVEPKSPKPSTTQPTPEQILNSGSIEKAREEVKRNSQKLPEKANKSESASSSYSLQTGSFSNREAAETQKAKVALLGIHADITTAQVNGKTVYRVQTARMDKDHSEQVRKTLLKNGISPQLRTH